MIAFSCAHCGMRYQAPPEYAGLETACPTCNRTLILPPAAAPPAAVDGRPGVRAALAQQGQSGERYVVQGEIARGGMGSILRTPQQGNGPSRRQERWSSCRSGGVGIGVTCSPFVDPAEMGVNQLTDLSTPLFEGGCPCRPRSHSSPNPRGVL
jgi:hypothetical protein